MPIAQKNITLGTAGHVDHGKTALVKLLTGCDTDRLKIEKERGMSIELGFAPCMLAEMEVGIVDVPGHENFIKTMVAGASGIDGVILVIAADDGVMQQTREHLDILTLLGVKYGIVALTKIDCVPPERIGIVTEQIKKFLAGTFLQDAPILPVSSVTSEGFDSFYEALKHLVEGIEPKSSDGVFRLPVERAFSVKGYGTVVAGIPVAGSAKIGDEMVIFPHGVKGRIKAIQVYKRNSQTAMVGQCAALNVPQWDYKTISRGSTVTSAEYFSLQQWYLCELNLLPHSGQSLKNGADVKFHTGTSEVVATLYLLQGNIAAAGQKCPVQVRLSEPIVAGPGDRFILRTLAPVQTVGGGIVVEATPEKLRRNQPETIQDAQAHAKAVLNRRDFVEYAIKTAETVAATEAEVSVRTKLPPGPLTPILAELIGENTIIELDRKLYIHPDTLAEVGQRLLNVVGNFHRGSPESPGISVAQLYEKSAPSASLRAGLRKDVFDGVLKLLLSGGRLVERKHRLALPEHHEILSDTEQKLLQAVEALFRSRLFNPPSRTEIVEHTRAPAEKVERTLGIMLEQERLIRVESDLLFHAEAVERARSILVSSIEKQGSLESVKFKYLLDTSRKFAIPLLDYFDRIGVTRSVGRTRYLAK
jgi:selenocysteine-specific elongation factor